MSKRVKITVFVIAILIFSFIIPTSYLSVMPGTIEDLGEMVEVDYELNSNEKNSFFMVTILQQGASLMDLFYGLLNPNIDIIHQLEVIPPGLDEEKYEEMMTDWMEESQLLAKYIAMEETGFEIEMENYGIEVIDFLEESPSKEYLEEDDVIVEVEGEEIFFIDQLLVMVQDREIGDKVELKVLRNDEMKTFNIPTVEHETEPGKPALGIYITTLEDQELSLPVNIEIMAGDISGPSAGIMFVVELINQLESEDITGGKEIAGTGTINYFKEVGAIGGVKQKVVTAENAGIEYFIIPEENYEEAEAVVKDMELVPVSTLQDVMDFLEE